MINSFIGNYCVTVINFDFPVKIRTSPPLVESHKQMVKWWWAVFVTPFSFQRGFLSMKGGIIPSIYYHFAAL